MQVLVVDDSPLMRRILTGLLQQEFEIEEVDEAKDGETALSIWSEGKTELVLLDWQLPGMSGIEVLQKIRESDEDIPIFMVTAETDREHILEAIDAGATDYIIKPITRKTVTEKIERVRTAIEHARKKDGPPFQPPPESDNIATDEGEFAQQ